MNAFKNRLHLIKSAILNSFYLEEYVDTAIRYNVVRQNLNHLILNSSQSGIAEENNRNETEALIVSLTTHGQRIHTVSLAIESIFQQTVKADKVILYLGKTDFTIASLPISLKKQIDRGLEIRFVEDIKSYTKVIPAMLEYPDALILTVDDDYMYPSDMIERLVVAHRNNPHAVCCSHSRKMTLSPSGKLNPYRSFDMVFPDSDLISSQLLAEGFGGVLYPPYCMPEECFDTKTFLSLCPSADDVWLKAMELLKGTPVQQIARNRYWFRSLTSEASVQDSGLVHYNNSVGNDLQMEAVFSHFNLYGKLR